MPKIIINHILQDPFSPAYTKSYSRTRVSPRGQGYCCRSKVKVILRSKIVFNVKNSCCKQNTVIHFSCILGNYLKKKKIGRKTGKKILYAYCFLKPWPFNLSQSSSLYSFQSVCCMMACYFWQPFHDFFVYVHALWEAVEW